MVNKIERDLEAELPNATSRPTSRCTRLMRTLRIGNAAHIALAEFSAYAATAAICAPFFPNSNSYLVIGTGVLVQTVVSVALRYFQRHVIREEDAENERGQEARRPPLCTFARYLNPIPTYWFTLGATFNILTLWHEFGHFLAAQALIEQPNASIIVYPYWGGLTTYDISSPTSLGNAIGQKRIYPLISIAGPGFSALAAPIFFLIAKPIRTRFPEIARGLNFTASICYLRETNYALSTFFMHKGDFQVLWNAGIHPLAAIAALDALPILYLGANIVQKIRSNYF